MAVKWSQSAISLTSAPAANTFAAVQNDRSNVAAFADLVRCSPEASLNGCAQSVHRGPVQRDGGYAIGNGKDTSSLGCSVTTEG